MTIVHDTAVLLALAIIAHAWAPRIIAPPAVLSAIGWALMLVAVAAIVCMGVRC